MLIRHADPDRDGPACAAIYAPAVRDAAISMEERVPDGDELARRIRTVSHRWPWLVAELDRAVVGYAYGSQHRDRAAYRWACDVTVYVSVDHHRRGIGRALYVPLLELLAGQGYHQACAGIGLPNAASVGLHEALGFVPVGVYRDIGYKLGAWCAVGWWQRELRPCRDDEPPSEIGPPGRLPG